MKAPTDGIVFASGEGLSGNMYTRRPRATKKKFRGSMGYGVDTYDTGTYGGVPYEIREAGSFPVLNKSIKRPSKRKVKKFDWANLSKRFDELWRTMPERQRDALRPAASKKQMTNYMLLRRRLLNRLQRAQFPYPLGLDLNTGHYYPVEQENADVGEVVELRWTVK